MALIEHANCTIRSLNSKGLGIGRTSYGLVELPYTLPEEVVEFERHKYRGQSDFVLKNIIQQSPARIKPICEYFGACGGCTLQHLNAESYIEFKTNLIKKPLDNKGVKTLVKPLISVPFGMRRRANFKILKKNNKIYFGFHRIHSHQIINIDKCPAILKNLSELIIILKEFFCEVLNDRQKVELFLSQAENGSHMLITTEVYISLTQPQLAMLKNIAKNSKIIKVSLKFNSIIQTIYETEQPYVIFGNKTVKVEANSFLQASTLSESILKDLVLDFFSGNKHNFPDTLPNLIDLFCGSGTFSIPLSQFFNVSGYEIDSNSLLALNQLINSNNLNITTTSKNLFTHPISKMTLKSFNYALINPPRVGAKEQCTELAFSEISKIAYISCNPESFINDSKILIKGGYRLLEVTPLDQFPLTAHLEIVGKFEK